MISFIDEIVDSFVVWDLLIGFSRRPDTVGTSKTFSTLLGRPQEDVDAGLQRLAGKGLLRVRTIDTGETFFEFNPASTLVPTLREFTDLNDSQENRLKILSRLLHRGVSQ